MVLKKVTAIVLAVLLLPAWGIPIMASDSPAQFETELAFLGKIGILPEDFSQDAPISRGEFASIVAKLMHPDLNFLLNEEESAPVFSDVLPAHKYYSYIKACRDLKIISGDGSVPFRPDDPILVIEAMTMLINALGYTPYALAAGGYPTGHYAVAKSSGISKGVPLTSTDGISGAIVGKLIYNALFADMVEFDSITGETVSVEIVSGKNLLSQRLGIIQYDAIVVDNGIISLFGETMGDMERVMLQDQATGNRVTVFSAETGIDGYVGVRVKVFVKTNQETGRSEVVYFEEHPSSKRITISGDSVIVAEDTYLEYEMDRETGKTEKLNFSSASPIVFFNGLKLLNYTKEFFRPEDGLITLSDFNKDGRYDVISIYSFNYYGNGVNDAPRNIVVDRASSEDFFISCKFNPAMSLDLDPDLYGYKILSPDKKTLDDISEYDIVSVAQAPELIDGKIFYFLLVSSESEPVTINAVTATQIHTGEKEIELSKSILSIKKNYTSQLKIGTQATICYDVTGKAAYLILPDIVNNKYGYLIKATVDTGMGDTVQIKYLSKEGKVTISSLSTNAKIDGIQYNTAQEQLAALKKRPDGGSFMGEDATTKPISRPMIYEVNNDGLVTKVDTDTPNQPVTTENTAYSNQYFVKYSKEEIDKNESLMAAYRSPRIAELRKGANSVDGKFYFSSSTVVISVPDIDTYGLETFTQTKTDSQAFVTHPLNYDLIKLHELEKIDSNYKIIAIKDLNAINAMDIQAYNIDPDTGMAGLIVIRGSADVPYYGNVSYSSSYPMYVFLRKSSVYDESMDKIITKIYYTRDGVGELNAKVDTDSCYFAYRYMIEGSLASENPFNTLVKPLVKGDIIRVFQTDGYLTHLERVFDITDIKASYSSNLFPSSARNSYSTTVTGGVRVPFNLRYYYGGQSQTYLLGAWYAKSLKGGALAGFFGFNNLSSVKPGDSATYTDQYLNIAGQSIVVLTKEKNGEIKIKEGTTVDIDCYENTKDLNRTSIILLRHTNYKVEQLFVLNGF